MEVLEVLQKTCFSLRTNRKRPELAGPAAKLEMEMMNRLAELERLETPDLPKRREKEEVAA